VSVFLSFTALLRYFLLQLLQFLLVCRAASGFYVYYQLLIDSCLFYSGDLFIDGLDAGWRLNNILF